MNCPYSSVTKQVSTNDAFQKTELLQLKGFAQYAIENLFGHLIRYDDLTDLCGQYETESAGNDLFISIQWFYNFLRV